MNQANLNYDKERNVLKLKSFTCHANFKFLSYPVIYYAFVSVDCCVHINMKQIYSCLELKGMKTSVRVGGDVKKKPIKERV